MPEFFLQVNPEFPGYSLLPEDVTTNVFNFQITAATRADAATVVLEQVRDFYNTEYSGHAIGEFLSTSIPRDANAIPMQCREFDPSDGSISPIFLTGAMTLHDQHDDATFNLPFEVAVVSSFHGDLIDIPEEEGVTRPAARRRGRLYLGPLNDMAISKFSERPRPETQLINAAMEATEDLANDGHFRVWSRVGQSVFPVVGGWVDDEFDTQRRRGQDPSQRFVWSV